MSVTRRLALLAMASLFVAACGNPNRSVARDPAHHVSNTMPPATARGLVVGPGEFAPTLTDTARSAPTLVSGLSVQVYKGNDGATLSVLSTSGHNEKAIVEFVTVEDSRNCQMGLSQLDANLSLTLSNTEACEETIKTLASALTARRFAGLAEAINETLPGLVRTGGSPNAVLPGYAITYSSGSKEATLTVNAASGPIDIEAVSAAASQSFVRHDAKGEFVLSRSLETEPWVLVWQQDGFLAQLIGDRELIERLRTEVVTTEADPVAAADAQGSAAFADTSTIDDATVAGFALSRKVGLPGSPGAVCVSSQNSVPTCTEFSAVGSFGSIMVGSTWYIVAVVPAGEPTTSYRTDPDLKFDTASGRQWTFGIAEVPAITEKVTAYYTTQGMPYELSTTWTRPAK